MLCDGPCVELVRGHPLKPDLGHMCNHAGDRLLHVMRHPWLTPFLLAVRVALQTEATKEQIVKLLK